MTDDLLQQTLAEMERRLADAREEVGVSPSRFGAGGADSDEVLETAVDLSSKAEREAADDVLDTIRQTPALRVKICAALEGISGDAMQIISGVVPLLVINQTITATAGVLSVVGLVLARGGARVLCTES